MEELEELEEGRQVKNSHPTDQQTLPQTHTHTLLSLFAPPPTFTLSHFRQGPADLTSHGGGEVLERVCFLLTQHTEF